MAKRHNFSNWFYSITKQKILLRTNGTASKLLFLCLVQVLELLNQWWCGCSGLKFAILYVKRCASSGSVHQVGNYVIGRLSQKPFFIWKIKTQNLELSITFYLLNVNL
jgi:hypothetical protein